jgi:hypothetical protein
MKNEDIKIKIVKEWHDGFKNLGNDTLHDKLLSKLNNKLYGLLRICNIQNLILPNIINHFIDFLQTLF